MESVSEQCRKKADSAMEETRVDLATIVGVGFGYLAARESGWVVLTLFAISGVFLAFHVYQVFSWFRLETRALAAEQMMRELDEAEGG